MRTIDVLLSVTVVIMIISIVCIWFFPSVQDFMLGNTLWNGLRDFCDESGASNIDSLTELPALPQGKTLISIPYLQYTREELSKLQRPPLLLQESVASSDNGFQP